MIEISPEENIQDYEMTQGENKEVAEYNKSKKSYDWSDKTLHTCRDKQKIEDEIGIISTFAN